jgi:hypothetical protein
MATTDADGDAPGLRPSFLGPLPTKGMVLGRTVEAIERVHGADIHEQLDRLPPGVRAVVTLDEAIKRTYGDGLESLYAYGADGICDEVVRAAGHLGAYAELFRSAAAVLPAEVRREQRTREVFLVDHPDVLADHDRRFYALEDAGDVLIDHVLRYVETHPEEFPAP